MIEDLEVIRDELNRKGAEGTCIVCDRAAGWETHSVALDALTPGLTAGKGHSIAAICLICRHCGFIRLHSRNHLFMGE